MYFSREAKLILLVVALIIIVIPIVVLIIKAIRKGQYKKLTAEIQLALGVKYWMYMAKDASVHLKSAKAVENYQPIQFFKDNRDKLEEASKRLDRKRDYARRLQKVLDSNEYKDRPMYKRVAADMKENISRCFSYYVMVSYVSPAGRSTKEKVLSYDRSAIDSLIADPSALMSKSEYNQYIKGQNKELLEQKQHTFYEQVNEIIDYANDNRERLLIKGDKEELDRLIAALFDRTVNSIKKIKDVKSEEWDVIGTFVFNTETEVKTLVQKGKRILDYYNSSDFEEIKSACKSLMDSQREFNEYIDEKAQAISKLFGTRVARNETVVDDEYNYIRPYKKNITPFTAEVSSQVFASAENSPIEYIIKNFYPNKEQYPEQIQKLQLLVEELETLKDAKKIIDDYKKDYQQYITNVPDYVLENDEDGFYSRLGFANISESVLTVEYMFSYTSNGGFAHRYFTVPMTEETIVELINALESKLTIKAFAQEQRALMTSKLRQQIKERDDFTCKNCGNSTHKEPNLLLEIDHIIPVSKGGFTEERNLQTLCWKCNRSKSDKLL